MVFKFYPQNFSSFILLNLYRTNIYHKIYQTMHHIHLLIWPLLVDLWPQKLYAFLVLAPFTKLLMNICSLYPFSTLALFVNRPSMFHIAIFCTWHCCFPHATGLAILTKHHLCVVLADHDISFLVYLSFYIYIYICLFWPKSVMGQYCQDYYFVFFWKFCFEKIQGIT